jgi:hypothetical protein
LVPRLDVVVQTVALAQEEIVNEILLTVTVKPLHWPFALNTLPLDHVIVVPDVVTYPDGPVAVVPPPFEYSTSTLQPLPV